MLHYTQESLNALDLIVFNKMDKKKAEGFCKNIFLYSVEKRKSLEMRMRKLWKEFYFRVNQLLKHGF